MQRSLIPTHIKSIRGDGPHGQLREIFTCKFNFIISFLWSLIVNWTMQNKLSSNWIATGEWKHYVGINSYHQVKVDSINWFCKHIRWSVAVFRSPNTSSSSRLIFCDGVNRLIFCCNMIKAICYPSCMSDFAENWILWISDHLVHWIKWLFQ